MEAVWADMKKTILPSWMSSAPSNWGTAARGKLSADHWRTICTVHLPITLIRLWSSGTERQRSLLANLMDLVRAIEIASLRKITRQNIDEYNLLVNQYLDRIKNLFKGTRIRPTHHMLKHIGDFLLLMGPNHARNASAFERYVQFMQEQNMNMQPGECL